MNGEQLARRLQRGMVRLANRADGNLRKWGLQDAETLGLAVCEEAGELAQAILKRRHEGAPAARIAEEAVDLGALCLQVLALVEVEADADRSAGRKS